MTFDPIYISPVSGAVIGYFTNWLAIKMLFRPHGQKFLFGLKLPFTPGLIPKERGRLAASVGRTIKNHLLTEDALLKSFTSAETLSGVNKAIDAYIDKLKSDERTVGEIFGGAQTESFKKSFTEAISSAASNEDFHKTIAGFISNGVDRYKNMTLREILPRKTVQTLKVYAAGIVPKAAGMLRGFAEDNPSLDGGLKEILFRMIDENINAFFNIFIDKEKIYDNIKKSVLDYLASPENQNGLTLRIWAATDRLLDKKANEIFSLLPENIETDIEGLAAEKLGGFGRNIAEAALPGLTGRFLEKIYSARISSITETLEKNRFFSSARGLLQNFAETALKNGAAYVVSRLEPGRIAEEQMNAMPVDKAEEIIISVCSKELRAITWLGGLLGLFIGFLPILLRLF